MSTKVGAIDAGKIQALFAKIDVNCDGKIDGGEIKKAGYEPSIFNIPDGKQITSVQFAKIVNSNQTVQASLFVIKDNKNPDKDIAKGMANQNQQDKSVFEDYNFQQQLQTENDAIH